MLFEIFNLPAQFSINLDELEKKYFEFQKQFHPDKSSIDDISKSIKINEAYKILSNDFLRACYLLELKGIDILKDEKAIKVDVATLEKVLELQEEIAEISDANKIKELENKLNLEIKFLIAAASKCLDDNQDLLAAQFLIKIKYFKKSLEDLKIRKRKI